MSSFPLEAREDGEAGNEEKGRTGRGRELGVTHIHSNAHWLVFEQPSPLLLQI